MLIQLREEVPKKLFGQVARDLRLGKALNQDVEQLQNVSPLCGWRRGG